MSTRAVGKSPAGLGWSVSGAWFMPMRLVMAWLWITVAFPKLAFHTEGIIGLIRMMAEGNPQHPGGNPIGPFRHFLESVVLPHGELFAYLVILGETAVAISLLFGLLTRIGAVLGIFLLLNYWLGQGYMVWPWKFPVMIAPMIMIIVGHAGRWLGIDALLARKWPRAIFW